jgi:hypothetical protein
LPHPGTVLFTLLVVAGLLWAQSVGALPLRSTLHASLSTGTIAYQGRLADANGNPLTGTYNMIFRLYDTASGGTPLWTEQWTGSNGVKVSDGLFNVMLGSLTPIPQSVVTGHSSLWLGITVGTDDEMTPRVQLGSVPFAVQALTVPDGSVTTPKIADAAVTQAKLGEDVSLVPLNGSITTEKIADGAVTSAKLEHSGPHIPITPDENGLVKMAVLRQDDTTNTHLPNQVVLTGWGFITVSADPTWTSEHVSFGTTFSSKPVILVSPLMREHYGQTPDDIGDFPNTHKMCAAAHAISTTGFDVYLWRSDSTLRDDGNYGYTWIAIGTLE